MRSENDGGVGCGGVGGRGAGTIGGGGNPDARMQRARPANMKGSLMIARRRASAVGGGGAFVSARAKSIWCEYENRNMLKSRYVYRRNPLMFIDEITSYVYR